MCGFYLEVGSEMKVVSLLPLHYAGFYSIIWIREVK